MPRQHCIYFSSLGADIYIYIFFVYERLVCVHAHARRMRVCEWADVICVNENRKSCSPAPSFSLSGALLKLPFESVTSTLAITHQQ